MSAIVRPAIAAMMMLSAGCAVQQSTPPATDLSSTQYQVEAPAWNAMRIIYHCHDMRGEPVTLPVIYLNTAPGESFAVVNYRQDSHLMRIWPAASGARYVAVDEQRSYRWHSKGDEGVLSFMEADHEAVDELLLKDCKAQ